MNNRELAIEATTELLQKRDLSAIDHYWSPTYIQHSAVVADGREAVRARVAGAAPDLDYERIRVLTEGDLVVAHGRYTGLLGTTPLVGFNLWRVEGGRLAEHWEAFQPEVAETVSGHSQTDGPAEVTEPGQTAASKELVERFVRTVLIDGRYDRLPEYVDGENYIQHNPGIGDGLSGLTAAIEALRRRGIAMTYTTLHRSVAEGEFVFTQSEGAFGGKPHAFYDLFRVADGKLVEHWDVVAELTKNPPHHNGLF
jgi:predicted SnoaL-like aldol condensation-catalyzing enzyme